MDKDKDPTLEDQLSEKDREALLVLRQLLERREPEDEEPDKST